MNTVQDWSGNNRDGTGVATGGSKPRYRSTDGPNSLPCIRPKQGDGVNGYFTLPDFLTGFTAGHGFAVMKKQQDPPTSSTPCAVLSDWGTGGIDVIPFTDGKLYCAFGTNARKDNITNSVGTMTNWRLYEERSASGAWSNYLDGTQLHTTGTNTVAWSTTPKIGFTGGASGGLEGDFAECFFFSRILNSTELQTIYDYIQAKYGITLP